MFPDMQGEWFGTDSVRGCKRGIAPEGHHTETSISTTQNNIDSNVWGIS